MDWLSHLFSLLSAVVGGVLVLLADRWRIKRDADSRKAETVIQLYTRFLTSFHNALRLNQGFWSGIEHEAEGHGPYLESEQHRAERAQAESELRDAVWALVLRERNAEQQARIEAFANAFDDGPDHPDGMVDFAYAYPERTRQLRQDAKELLGAMQKIHGKILGLA